MAFNSFSANAFANNFMTGFAFVDQIKRSKRNEARLDQRLAEQREQRSFQRRRTIEADKQVRHDRANSAADRERQASERASREAGARAALDPKSTDEQLQEHAPFSPEASAELRRRGVEVAVRDAQTIGRASQAPATLTQGVTGVGPEGVAPSAIAPVDGTAAKQAASPQQTTAAPSSVFDLQSDQGLSGLQEISSSEANSFSDAFQSKGLGGKIVDQVAGVGSRVVRSGEDLVANLFNAPGEIMEGVFGTTLTGSFDATRQNPTQEILGRVNVNAAAWVDPEEFAAFEEEGNIEAIRAGRESNKAVVAEMESREHHSTSLDIGAFSRQGARAASSEQDRRNAIVKQNRAFKLAEDTLDPSKTSILDELSQTNPRAAASAYLETRATLQGVSPEQAQRLDKLMVPVMDQAIENISAELAILDPDTQQAKMKLRSLETLQKSRNVVAGLQPAVSDIAGVKPPGLKIGDQKRANDVVDVAFDPDRVVAEYHTPQALSAAITMVGRITPATKRLNKRQIHALVILAEARLIDKSTFLTVTMTGAWPPGKNPKGIRDFHKVGDDVWALHNDDTISLMPDSDSRNKHPDRTMDDEKIGWMLQGAMTTGMSESERDQAIGLLSDNAGWVRKFYNVNNQESMMAAGRAFGQSVFLSSKRKAQMDNDYIPWTNSKNGPTPDEIFLNPTMRNALAKEFNVKPVAMPAGIIGSDMDTEQIRASIAEGKVDGIDPKEATTLSEDDLLYIYWVLNAPPDAIEEANRANSRN